MLEYRAGNSLPDYTIELRKNSPPEQTPLSSSDPRLCTTRLLPQQYEDQQDTPETVFYVTGAWHCDFLFRVEATQRDLHDERTSVEVRVYSASLLSAMRQTRLPIIFQTTSSLEATWNLIFQEIALDPAEYSRGSLGESKVSSQLLGRQIHGER